jgi:hypothetical protein
MKDLINKIKKIFEKDITEDEAKKRFYSVIRNVNLMNLIALWHCELEVHPDYFLLVSFSKEIESEKTFNLAITVSLKNVIFEISKSWYKKLPYNSEDPYAAISDTNYQEECYTIITKLNKDREYIMQEISENFIFNDWSLLTDKIKQEEV